MQRRPIESAATIQLPLKPSVLTVPLLSSCDPCENRIPKVAQPSAAAERAGVITHGAHGWHGQTCLGTCTSAASTL
jgi:hypothetical protein